MLSHLKKEDISCSLNCKNKQVFRHEITVEYNVSINFPKRRGIPIKSHNTKIRHEKELQEYVNKYIGKTMTYEYVWDPSENEYAF